jgi:hypothetical protein
MSPKVVNSISVIYEVPYCSEYTRDASRKPHWKAKIAYPSLKHLPPQTVISVSWVECAYVGHKNPGA